MIRRIAPNYGRQTAREVVKAARPTEHTIFLAMVATVVWFMLLCLEYATTKIGLRLSGTTAGTVFSAITNQIASIRGPFKMMPFWMLIGSSVHQVASRVLLAWHSIRDRLRAHRESNCQREAA